MAIKTHVTWNREMTVDEANLRLNRLMQDDIRENIVNGSFVLVDGVATREWNSLEAAQTWIDFINTFTPPPVLAEIVEE